jgi:hypothetical protein
LTNIEARDDVRLINVRNFIRDRVQEAFAKAVLDNDVGPRLGV